MGFNQNQGKPSVQSARPLPTAQQGGASGTAVPGKKTLANSLFYWLDYIAFGRFLREEIGFADAKLDETEYYLKRRRILTLIKKQTYVIFALVVLIIAIAPYTQPIYTYQARTTGPKSEERPLVPLTEPNMTDQAVLSWAEASITEILTFGFGDFDRRILAQKHRFTPDGWESFVDSLRKQNMRADFKLRQLVLTTAPANMAVIVSKGIDADLDYVWDVEMPIIMTYTTNNNARSGHSSIVRLTVARVPSSENVRGVGIKKWIMH